MPRCEKVLSLLVLSAIAVVCLTCATTTALGDAPTTTFAAQLRQLPSLVDAGCPRHWAWGGRGGLDPANPAHVQYARIAGGVIAFAGRADEVMRTAQVVQKARALGASVELGLRVHPFKGKFWKPKDRPWIPPTYHGPEVEQEITKIQGFLLSARIAASYQHVVVSRVFVDSETFHRDSNRAVDRRAWNAAMLGKHAAVVTAIRGIFPGVYVEFYNRSPLVKCTELNEDSRTASASLYELNRPRVQWDNLTRTIAFQHARGLESTTAYIALGAGWQRDGGKRWWNWEFDDDGTQARSVAKLLMRFDTRSVHHVVDYTAFDDRAVHWEKHVLIYFTALLESAR